MAFKDSVSKIKAELETRVDYEQLKQYQNSLELKISDLKKKLNQRISDIMKIRAEKHIVEDSAAFRNPYFVFNCLSCDRKFK